MPRQGPLRLPAGERDRRLAEEVLYLHSLWRSGGLAPAPIQPRSDRREQRDRPPLRGRLDRALNCKERKVDHAAAEPVLVPLLPYSSREAFGPSAPSTANPPQPEAEPSWLQFSNLDFADYDHNRPDSGRAKAEEEEAARYFTGLFRRDASLRGHYTGDWRNGRFQCMVCTAGGAQKPPRHFRGCFALVQHARNPPRSRWKYGRHGAHRALAAVVCRLLGWDLEAMVRRRVVDDSRATAGGQRRAKEKKNGAGENNGSSTDDDSYLIDEDEESDDDEESVDEEEDSNKVDGGTVSSSDDDYATDIVTGIPDPATDDDEDDSEIEDDVEYAEKEDRRNRMEDSSTDGDEDANELERSQEEDADTGAEGPNITDGDKEAIKLDNSEKPEKEAVNSIARKWDMKINDHLLSPTHAKMVGTPPKKTDIQKKSHVKEVSTPGCKFYEGSGKAKRKASALSYQGQSSTSGVVKKVKVNQQPSNKGKQKQSNKTNETGASARQAKQPAVAARKGKQLAKKQKQSSKTNETGVSARKAKRPAVAARKAKQLAKKQRAKKHKGGLNS